MPVDPSSSPSPGSLHQRSRLASIQLLATDYDGTLAERGVVTRSTWAALERWKASGRQIVLVTGRAWDELPSVCDRLDLFDRIVAENGAWLAGPAGAAGRALGDRPPDSFIAALQAAGVEPIAVGRVVIATWQPHAATIQKIIQASGLALQVIANKRALMILPAGVGKASGLQAALNELAVDPARVAGIGDAENDLELLDACGLRIAVANAIPALRAAADIVTQAERGAGVAEWVDTLLAGSSAV